MFAQSRQSTSTSTSKPSQNSGRPRCGVASLSTIPRQPMLSRSLIVCGSRVICARAGWRNRSSRLAVPLSKIQTDILRLLAIHRDPESYVAGSTPLNKDTPRYSGDIDVFHDREERVALAAEADGELLRENGYAIEWLRREPAIYGLLAARGSETTKLEWVADSDFRFFPTVRDDTFGYVLHPVDLATNKVAAAYGRREPRDVVDLLTIHDRILPLGAVVWASAGKALGFTPEGIINEIRRMARYTVDPGGRPTAARLGRRRSRRRSGRR